MTKADIILPKKQIYMNEIKSCLSDKYICYHTSGNVSKRVFHVIKYNSTRANLGMPQQHVFPRVNVNVSS